MTISRRILGLLLTFVLLTVGLASVADAAPQLERLGRGVVAIRTAGGPTYISWRMLGTDPASVAFNLYRSTGGAAPIKLNAAPLTATTDFVDATADRTKSSTYSVRPVVNGVEQAASAGFTTPANAPARPYLSIPLQPPAGGTTPDGVAYTYDANDASVGDLDGDGAYEIVLK